MMPVNNNEVIVVEETDWTVGDLELLKKQMVKNPVGMPGRWEAVAEAFSGRHKVESVVKMAKSTGDKKLNDSDSFSRFLKDRKAVDKRVDEVIKKERENVSDQSWSSAEDIALGVVQGRKEKLVSRVIISDYLKSIGIILDELEEVELPSTVDVMRERVEFLIRET
ncbi:hypothetical protein L1987_07723 [Smallanthus sonchifolius]|uniref:Uncharacterized protein n=1 Tax=Smallanthus sonchifolius TaxID=185202 RepID=A0ACB9K130_9ASTR|nr:hypothetical protein L1987_07723 [Smallanthus sonchifolius]